MHEFITLTNIAEREILPGFHAKMIHTDGLTIAYFRIVAGSILPEHHHMHEQVSNVLEGEFELTINGEAKICKAGDVATIPSDVPHAGRAITDCRILDIFRPAREEYK